MNKPLTIVTLCLTLLSTPVMADRIPLNQAGTGTFTVASPYQSAQAVAYFDRAGRLIDTASEAHFYRIQLATTADGWYTLQDFYQDGHKKLTDPYTVKNISDFESVEPEIFEGSLIRWYENGQKMTEGHYKNGVKEGVWTVWDDKGNKAVEERHVNGKQEGLSTWYYFHDNDSKMAAVYYKNDKQEGLAAYWYESGQKKVTVYYKNGEADGPATYWYENGQKMAKGHYKNGKWEGVWLAWDKNGKKEAEDAYKNGELIEK